MHCFVHLYHRWLNLAAPDQEAIKARIWTVSWSLVCRKEGIDDGSKHGRWDAAERDLSRSGTTVVAWYGPAWNFPQYPALEVFVLEIK